MNVVYYLERKKKEERSRLIVFMLLLSDLIIEFFILGEKSELPQKFPTNGIWSGLESFGIIFFSQMLYWSNGYCITPSSSDDG
jgi:hypothetical protein